MSSDPEYPDLETSLPETPLDWLPEPEGEGVGELPEWLSGAALNLEGSSFASILEPAPVAPSQLIPEPLPEPDFAEPDFAEPDFANQAEDATEAESPMMPADWLETNIENSAIPTELQSHEPDASVRAELCLRLREEIQHTACESLRWEIEVSNIGTVPAINLRLALELPLSVEAEANGSHEFGTLEPGQSRLVVIQLRPTLPGHQSLVVSLSGENAETSTATTQLNCEPNPNLAPGLLEQMLPEVAPAREDARSRRHRTDVNAQNGVQHLLFSLGGTEYAVPLTNVVEIARVPSVFPVPNTPSWLLGVVNLRGDIVSLMDLATYLCLEEQDAALSTQRLLVAKTNSADLVAGLVVDRLSGIRYLAKAPENTFTTQLNDRLASFVTGVEEFNNRLLVRLDLDRLLSAPDLRRFEAV